MGVGEVRGMVKTLMFEVGLAPRLFGAHSLRIGGASAAFAAGIEPSAIRLAGRPAASGPAGGENFFETVAFLTIF